MAAFQSCFDNWVSQQHEDLEELLAQQSIGPKTNCDNEKVAKLALDQLLVAKGIKHFEEYSEKRAIMVQRDPASFMSPSWCSSFENALLWIGGCRPSLSVRLVYSVCGSEMSDDLAEFFLDERKDNLAEISAQQLHMVNSLHCKTVREEDMMSTRMAAMQEDLAELPLKRSEEGGESKEEVERAIDAYYLSLASIVKDADKLRLITLKEMMAILTPGQGVDLLLATKKLHLSVHEWGKRMHPQSEKKEASTSNK